MPTSSPASRSTGGTWSTATSPATTNPATSSPATTNPASRSTGRGPGHHEPGHREPDQLLDGGHLVDGHRAGHREPGELLDLGRGQLLDGGRNPATAGPATTQHGQLLDDYGWPGVNYSTYSAPGPGCTAIDHLDHRAVWRLGH